MLERFVAVKQVVSWQVLHLQLSCIDSQRSSGSHDSVCYQKLKPLWCWTQIMNYLHGKKATAPIEVCLCSGAGTWSHLNLLSSLTTLSDMSELWRLCHIHVALCKPRSRAAYWGKTARRTCNWEREESETSATVNVSSLGEWNSRQINQPGRTAAKRATAGSHINIKPRMNTDIIHPAHFMGVCVLFH